MSAIRILPDRVANQIAAGEVVERPAAVVKELVENALDAGASRIEVEFRHGGRSFIRVEDNGSGMSRDDALLCLERHATSKIREATDLDRVLTFGFRGEAMPSIASVSRFVLQTRDAASAGGTEVLVNGGKIMHVRDCGMPVGTRVTVSHLFNSVPARRKFLKSDATEAAHVIHHSRLYALASPQVAFTLIDDGREVFRSPNCAELGERVGEVFGREFASGLLPIAAREGDLALSGLISPPGVARATRHEMITFVNRRPVESRTLAYALLESYHTLIPKGRYPVAFVFLSVDPAGVDVNVHPAKREVRFRDEARVRGFLIRTVLEALRQAKWPGQSPAAEIVPSPSPPAVVATPAAVARTESSLSPASRPAVEATNATAAISARPQNPLSPAPHAAAAVPGATQAAAVQAARRFGGWKLLGGFEGGYNVFAAGAGLIVLDRRAAAERVWFERLAAQYRAGHAESQRLLFPLPLELDAVSAATLGEHLGFLRAHGLEVEPFGRDFFRIEAIPAWLEPTQADAFIRDVLGLIRNGQIDGRNVAASREELARLAASRAAVRAAEQIAPEALEALITDLLRCAAPHASPGGRPTFIEIGPEELMRRFHKRFESPHPPE